MTRAGGRENSNNKKKQRGHSINQWGWGGREVTTTRK